MSTLAPDQSFLKEAVGLLALVLLFGVCTFAAPLSLQLLGPWVALGASVTAFLTWAFLGPPPLPGVLPGALGITVLLNSSAWSAFSILLIMQAW